MEGRSRHMQNKIIPIRLTTRKDSNLDGLRRGIKTVGEGTPPPPPPPFFLLNSCVGSLLSVEVFLKCMNV